MTMRSNVVEIPTTLIGTSYGKTSRPTQGVVVPEKTRALRGIGQLGDGGFFLQKRCEESTCFMPWSVKWKVSL